MELEAVLRFARAADVANFGPGGYVGGHEMGPPRLRLPMALEILSAKLGNRTEE